LETITIEVATHELGRVLYSALSAFYPELEPDADGTCIVSVRPRSETQMLEISEHAVNSVSFVVGHDQYSRGVQRPDEWPRPRLTLLAGGGPQAAEDEHSKTYAVQILLLDGGTSNAGLYDSPTGKLPWVNDVIPVDKRGGRARVTAVSRSNHPPIRADLLR
jgi:hypothetical protein